MIVVLLAVLALMFGVSGFLLHAAYIGRQDLTERLFMQVEALKAAVLAEEGKSAAAREENLNMRKLIQTLEARTDQNRRLLQEMKELVKEKEEEIRMLRGSADRTSGAQPEHSSIGESEKALLLQQVNARKIPLWKDNLNNILGMLERIEKDV